MKASSLPDPYRETTSYPSFFTTIKDPADHHQDTTGDDKTLNKRQKIACGDDNTLNEPSKTNGSEPSETSPFKVILSASLSSNEMNNGTFQIVGSFTDCDQDDQSVPQGPPIPDESDSIASVGSNQFIRDGELLQLQVENLSRALSDEDEFGRAFRMSDSTLWVKNFITWWDCSIPDFPDPEFKRAFKMSKSTFEFICSELDPVITMRRSDIPVHQRVAVCLWHLATGESLEVVSSKFGLATNTCGELVVEVCGAIKSVLMNKFLTWPDGEKLTRIKGEWEQASGIPNVGGSMYTTHVPIIAPTVYERAYFNERHTERNQKTSYSITIQGVVDAKGVFTEICIGWPGSLSDEKILEKSAISQRASYGLLKNVWIVGNAGYPLMDWVLVPYAQQNLVSPQSVFNEKVGEVSRVAKEAFSRLKGRWSCLQKRTEVKLEDLPVVLGACCVLHNICEMRGEAVDPTEMNFDLFDDEIAPENPVRSADAVQARDQIARSLLPEKF